MERTDGYQALDEIFRPCSQDGEGCLHLWLGNTRMGKTYANRILVQQMLLRKHTDAIFTVDEKDPENPQYEGIFRANSRHLLERPLFPYEREITLYFGGLHIAAI